MNPTDEDAQQALSGYAEADRLFMARLGYAVLAVYVGLLAAIAVLAFRHAL